MLHKLDDIVFDRFPALQRIANQVEYFTLVCHATLARLIVIIGTAVAGSAAWIAGNWVALLAIGCAVIIFLFISLEVSNQKVASQSKNQLRIDPVLKCGRTLLLLYAVLGGIFRIGLGNEGALADMVGMTAVAFGYYLISCDKLPPGKRFLDRFRKQQIV